MDLLEQPGRGRAGAGARERARQAGQGRPFLRELPQHRGECVDRRLGILGSLEEHGTPEQDLEPPRRVVAPRLRELRQDRNELVGTPLPERIRSSASSGSTSSGTAADSLRQAVTCAETSPVRSRVRADRRR